MQFTLPTKHGQRQKYIYDLKMYFIFLLYAAEKGKA